VTSWRTVKVLDLSKNKIKGNFDWLTYLKGETRCEVCSGSGGY
jgi:hypothetical protein